MNNTITLRITLENGQLRAGVQQSEQMVRGFGRAATDAGQNAARAFTLTARGVADVSNRLSAAKSTLLQYAAAWQGLSIGRQFAAGVIEATRAMDGWKSSLKTATGSAAAGAAALGFVRTESERLGISLNASASEFAKFAAAARGTAIEGQAARDIFTAVAEASRALNLSAEQTGGALNALQQMISKGTVSAEELRGQLGERIPGAFGMAAAAMGVTTQQLGKMLEAGTIAADVLLPKLATEMHRVFGAAANDAAGNAAADFERMGNAAREALAAIGNSGVMQAFAQAATLLAGALRVVADHAGLFATVMGGVVAVGVGKAISLLANYASAVSVARAETAAVARETLVRAAADEYAARITAQKLALELAAARAEAGRAAYEANALARMDALVAKKIAAAVADENSARLALLNARNEAVRTEAENALAIAIQKRAGAEALANANAGRAGAAAAAADAALLRRADLAEELAIAQNNLTKSTGALATAKKGLASIGSTLWSLMGGWIGVAALGAYGIYALATSILEANRAEAARIKEFEAGITNMREATRATEELTAARAAQAAGAGQSVADVYAQEARNLELIAQKTEELAQARERLLFAQMDRLRNRDAISNNPTSAEIQARKEVDALTAAIDRLRNATADYTGPTTARLLAFLADDLPNAARDAKAAMDGVFAAMRGGDVFGGISALAGAFGKVMDQVRKRFKEADKAGNEAFAALAKGAADSAKELDKFGKSQTQIAQAMVDANIAAMEAAKMDRATIDAAKANGAAIVANVAALEAKQKAARGAAKEDKAAARAAELLASANADLARSMIDLAVRNGDMSEALGEYARGVMDAYAQAEKLRAAKVREADVTEFLTQALAANERAYRGNTQAAEQDAAAAAARANVVGRLLADLDEEIRLSGMSAQARRVEEIVLRAVAERQEEINRGNQAAIALGPLSADSVRGQVAARLEEIDALDRARQAQEDYENTVVQGSQAMASAWGDWIVNGMRDFGSFADSIKNIFKRMIADMIAQAAQSGFMRILSGLFGLGGSSAAMAGTGGGGIGGIFSSLFGGIGQLFGGGGGGTGASMLPALAALAGGAFGLTNRGSSTGSAGSIAAAGAYGYAGYALGTVGYGAALGASGALAGGASAAAGATSGALGAAGAIPVVGWIIAAIAAIDMITGGKVFGTRYRAESGTTSLNLSEEGGSASQTIREVRQRALFGGRQWRNRSVTASDEAVEAAQQLFDNVRGVMTDAARALNGEAPAMIDAALRTVVEYDKKGKVKATKYFVDLMGRTWEEETAEAATQRIMAESMIATIDSILGTTVEAASTAAGAATGDVVAGAGAGVARGIGEVTDVLAKTVAVAQGEASAIAERWRGDAATLMDGAQMLLAAATDIRRGAGLLGEGGTLTQVADLIEDLQEPGEALAATYQRVAASAALFDEALGLAGVSLDRSREEIVRFAVDITEAAGGLERAQQLWSAYFQTFYTDAERLQYQIAQAQQRAAGQFGDIGLDLGQFTGEGGAAAFRALFESVLPTLSAQAVVEWLEAAEALGILIDLSAQAGDAIAGVNTGLQDLMADVAEQLAQYAPPPTFSERLAAIATGMQEMIDAATEMGATEADLAQIRLLGQREMQAVLEEQAQAYREYAGMVRGLADEAADLRGISAYQREMREIGRWTQETTDALNAAARAAGMQAAAEADLALVHEIAAGRAAAAMERLRDAGRDVVAQLYGADGGLADGIDEAGAAIGTWMSNVTGGMEEVTQATDNAVQAQLGAQQRIRDWLDNLLGTDLGGLRPRDQLRETQALFDRTLAAALGGDAEAMGELPALADQMLRLGQRVYASGAGYFDLRDSIRAALEQVANLVPEQGLPAQPGAGGAGAGGGYAGGGYVPDVSFNPQQQQQLAEQAAAERRALALELAGIVRDLIGATGDPLEEIAAQLGFSMADLIADLGVNLDDLNAAAAGQLAAIAQAMGAELTDLASSVGVNLGDLGDRQSLLNDALEGRIGGLPQAERDLLAPLLQDIEEAAALGDTAGVEAGILAMEDAIAEMSPELRDMLAPFFLRIAPADPETELQHLATMESTLGSSLAELQVQTITLGDILAELGGDGGLPLQPTGPLTPGGGLGGGGGPITPPGYAVGTGYVPRDGLAYLHQGEAVLPASVSAFFRREGIPIAAPVRADGGRTDALLAEMREHTRAVRETQQFLRAIEQRVQSLETTTARGSADQVRATDRQTDKIKASKT